MQTLVAVAGPDRFTLRGPHLPPVRRGRVEETRFEVGEGEVIDLHMLMSSFCCYRVSNRHTFGEIFQIDLSDDQVKLRHKAMICDAVLRYIQVGQRP